MSENQCKCRTKKNFFLKVIGAFSAFALAYVLHLLIVNGQAEVNSSISVAQTNGDNGTALLVRNSNFTSGADLCVAFGLFLTLVAIFWNEAKCLIKGATCCKVSLLVAMVGVLSLTGCRKPYDVPQYEMIQNNETAFVIPLEGNTSSQAKFASAEALAKFKVASKRIQITHRWNQTGRWEYEGNWIPDIQVVKVNRTPIAQQWWAENKEDAKGNGLWVESADSVGFNTGFQVVAQIDEENTELFLYSYNGNTLATVMNGEIRARVQSKVAELAAKYNMDDLRSRKNEITEAIRADVIPWFAKKGITVSTIGNFGGFSYENPKIQEAIDMVFQNQMLKNNAAAQLAAQADINKRLKEEGLGQADKTREIARGNKDADVLAAEGEAAKIKLVADAIQAAASNPVFLEMKRLEVQGAGLNKWDGKLPMYQFGGSSAAQGVVPNLVQMLPALPAVQHSK